ncbi:phosphatidylinositol 4,5-bisphosphate 3-kinase catalytic subunit beta isoform-like isoform X1 [Clavelina lepadiformis]|uniref:phosphatidylinositol 4,5-bisphosphate 3-kinase catalytic subunit beta isoform-like isoform X1 n=1 Tax=Clavelina lepadiformis TaxID=159417 RepID=UPI0040414B0B
MYGYDEEESIYDEWGYHSSLNVSVDFLLPTGIYIPMDIPRNSTMHDVKQLLWKEAILYPLFSKLVSPESYTFVYITNYGLQEEIVDETKHLSEFDLMHELPVLRLIQTQGNIEEKRIVQEIHQLAGIKNDNDLNIDSECINFRKEMRELAVDVSKERDNLHWKDLLEREYPPTIVPHLNENTHYLREFGLIQLRYENVETSFTIKVNPKWIATMLTKEALYTWLSKTKIRLPSNNPDDYVLEGQAKEYIVGDYPIFNFNCLRDALVSKREALSVAAKAPPSLTLIHVATIRKILPESSMGILQMQQASIAPPVPGKRRGQTWSLWQIDTHFCVKVLRAGNVTGVQGDKKLIVHIGVFHGLETLCATAYTKEPTKEGAVGNEYIWNEDCYFDINTCNLPPSAKLCMAICAIKGRTGGTKKDKKDNNIKALLATATPLAWINMPLFDYRQCLKSGILRLNCWKWNQGETLDSNNLKPRGVVTMNPDSDEAPFLEIQMVDYNASVVYPPHEKVLEEAAHQASAQANDVFPHPAKSHLLQLSEIMKKDRFDDLFDNEKHLLWHLRLDCRELYPEALSKVLLAAKWNSYKTVALIQAMLQSWPPLPSERAMELLDFQFADQRVRDFAVQSFESLRNDELQQYLMQLVQVLKFDTFLNSSLVQFILQRAWQNRRIGHFLFWHLKAEINTEPNVRLSLILEAYLYGNIHHMKELHKQHEALNKMKTLNERVKDSKFSQKDLKTRAKKALTDTASQDSFAEALTNVECPLHPHLYLEKLDVERCKIMNSKMRPLWLEFQNSNVPGKKISVIYKNGDDLRQDMLTLQIIKIMDSLWKSEGLDLKMIPYGCLATGAASGMIEVVTHSNTIANIQKSKGAKMSSAFRHQTLFEWIGEKNQNKSDLEQAIENFTYSCAGYCVATYVLGVGDRHSDNIMVTEKGQLFHIDFGHILGNFKSKYGIKRERVPFVLAHDFVHVINKGKTNEKKEFAVFRQLCERAFIIIRKKGYLFITLFALMLHSGLPELTSLEHLEYLRETLALHLTEEKALQQFRNQFKKALTVAWSTSVNWFFHNVHRD